ncbi:MAG: hypothetical protein PUD16_00805, partial [bacterium]|nr:hypothetical protein [bacterium]
LFIFFTFLSLLCYAVFKCRFFHFTHAREGCPRHIPLLFFLSLSQIELSGIYSIGFLPLQTQTPISAKIRGFLCPISAFFRGNHRKVFCNFLRTRGYMLHFRQIRTPYPAKKGGNPLAPARPRSHQNPYFTP